MEDRATALGSSLLQRAVISWTFGLSYQHITIERTGTRQTSGPGGHLYFCRVHGGSLSLLPICPVAATGKPFFVPPSYYEENIPSLPAWNFNVSHEGRLIVCAAEASRIIIMYIYSDMASQCLDHAWHFCNVDFVVSLVCTNIKCYRLIVLSALMSWTQPSRIAASTGSTGCSYILLFYYHDFVFF